MSDREKAEQQARLKSFEGRGAITSDMYFNRETAPSSSNSSRTADSAVAELEYAAGLAAEKAKMAAEKASDWVSFLLLYSYEHRLIHT